jgi:hypothetical protein
MPKSARLSARAVALLGMLSVFALALPGATTRPSLESDVAALPPHEASPGGRFGDPRTEPNRTPTRRMPAEPYRA